MAKHFCSASLTATLVAGAVLLLTGCGSGSADDAGSSSGDSAGLTSLKVGSSPTLTNASLYLATQDGTFKANNLKVSPQQVTSGAQALPMLLNGQIQFTAADPLGAIKAISEKMAVKIVGQGSVNATEAAKDSTVLVVAPGEVTSVAGLSGRTVAVNALGGLAEVAARAAIDAKGGTSKDVRFVEMSFTQMVAAVENGKVDGAVLNEPFVSQARSAGLTDLVPVMSTSMPTVPNSVYLTSESYAKSHPEVVQAFSESLDTANVTLSKDPAKIREVAAESTETSAEDLAKIVLPTFPDQPLSRQTLDDLQTLMVKYGILDSPVDLSSYMLVAQP
ncbi:ABC transporter substrate-binding protein [Streptomyces sp. NPDC056244]|uniref:ABC transporter substrate-binding protein n=1 Tax=Streptomyces sp. NPDC056244 TaxID=3345762 RepID=UPI0035D88D3E